MQLISADRIKDNIKAYILKEFLPGENPELLTDSTPLISGGILDSLATIKLIAFIEEHYQLTLEAHEADVDNLNTVSGITKLINSKLSRP
jgi:acyl carrier protein